MVNKDDLWHLIFRSLPNMTGVWNQTYVPSLCKKATIQQVTTMLATPKNVLFLGHNHLLTTSTDDRTLIIAGAWAIIKVKGHQNWWLETGYNLEIRHI